MEEKNEMDKIDDVILPGFRFHPTDEELVDFYLKRKIQQQPLSIELIRQVDIYKYDPWDLPKLASTGEKEWYFYCPRDRKYRNSTRPNRVTRAGFWKATGTDRPIYSSDGKCIGLKKSLVFYRGRAAKGIKTDWMMHEFRLPSLSDSSASPKKLLDKSLPPRDSWAICKIFKKTNSMSMAQKALSHSWMNHLPESMVSDILNQGTTNSNQFINSENISCTTEIGSAAAAAIQFCGSKELHQQVSSANLTATCSENIHSKCSQFPALNGDFGDNGSFIFSTLDGSTVEPAKCAAGSMILNPDYLSFEGPNQQFSGCSISVVADEQECSRKSSVNPAPVPQWEITGRPINGFPFSLPPNDSATNWKPINTLAWDSPSPPCPSDMSTSYSTNKCYT
ncbi:hypothetical protein L6164_006818 [Bauhinia variegata]|uniref:Uncharacterized protein n=1 Tax=Bauhinia variegata TaxID=167791 RepID=A0ACB9PVM7_BAUVA|nr:hypothetical protein L6164_006818 [Bauhinia variegata]